MDGQCMSIPIIALIVVVLSLVQSLKYILLLQYVQLLNLNHIGCCKYHLILHQKN